MKPPYIIFFTPSGRFEVKEKICLSFTNYHPEYWQPAWTIQNILVALVSFFPVNEEQLAIGAIRASKAERKNLAADSKDWKCAVCKMTNKEIADEFMLETTADAVKELEKDNVLGAVLNPAGCKPKVEETKEQQQPITNSDEPVITEANPPDVSREEEKLTHIKIKSEAAPPQ
jgi:ubiquitin-conjugating enzyme E2 J1